MTAVTTSVLFDPFLLGLHTMIRAAYSDKELILSILCAAFDDNLSVNTTVKQDDRRVYRIRGLMNYSFELCMLFGEVWLSDDKQGCALIMFPHTKRSTLKTFWLDIVMAFNVVGVSNVSRVMKKQAAIKANHPLTPFAHLWYIGVDPSAQGQGVGAGLMKELILKYELICLETSVARNIGFYEKLGFEVFAKLEVGYELTMMRKI